MSTEVLEQRSSDLSSFMQLCSLVPLQRYKNELTFYQKSAMIRKSSLKPEDLFKVLDDVGSLEQAAKLSTHKIYIDHQHEIIVFLSIVCEKNQE